MRCWKSYSHGHGQHTAGDNGLPVSDWTKHLETYKATESHRDSSGLPVCPQDPEMLQSTYKRSLFVFVSMPPGREYGMDSALMAPGQLKGKY